MKPVFLRAAWRNLILANYTIDPSILKPLVPKHTELDFWNNRCYVSLVGFMFCDTRVLGVPVPFHRNFEEVNLRFYVKHKDPKGEWKRGVVFVREFVPKGMITLVANGLYSEHYRTAKMAHYWANNTNFEVGYRWKTDGKWHALEVEASPQTEALQPGSEAEFISEHYWGYTKVNATTTSEYQVEHPKWNIHPVLSHNISIDTGKVYGSQFKEALEAEPKSVFLAEGSEIVVRGKTTLK